MGVGQSKRELESRKTSAAWLHEWRHKVGKFKTAVIMEISKEDTKASNTAKVLKKLKEERGSGELMR